jgi:hypothetical protein
MKEIWPLAFVLRFKWIFFLLLSLTLFVECGDIPRDNPLDPKNTSSVRAFTVMIEAFVNTDNPSQYNQYMLAALDSLIRLYPNQINVVEYHRNTQTSPSNYHLDKNEILYQNYLNGLGSSLVGVPDVFFNGISQRVQGASGVETALFRLQQALSSEIIRNSHYTLEISYRIQNSKIIPEVTLARLGSESASNFLIKAILISDQGDHYHKRVVGDYVKSTVISTLSYGDQQTITLPEMDFNPSLPGQLVFYICDSNESLIYQSASMRIQNNSLY